MPTLKTLHMEAMHELQAIYIDIRKVDGGGGIVVFGGSFTYGYISWGSPIQTHIYLRKFPLDGIVPEANSCEFL